MARGAGTEEDMKSAKMTSLLMLLSSGGEENKSNHSSTKKPTADVGRLFECKTCNRRFPTFQALGGHRTGHRRPRGGRGDATQMPKPKLHACPVCGLAFPMGQALGGHMRRHKLEAAAAAANGLHAEKKGSSSSSSRSGRELLWLDLNLPPLESELQLHSLREGVGFSTTDEEPATTHEFSSCSSSLSACL